jgi:hypothetical protein
VLRSIDVLLCSIVVLLFSIVTQAKPTEKRAHATFDVAHSIVEQSKRLFEIRNRMAALRSRAELLHDRCCATPFGTDRGSIGCCATLEGCGMLVAQRARARVPARRCSRLVTVALGPQDPTWKKLYEAMASVAGDAKASFAFVLDCSNGLWCVAIPGRPPTIATHREDGAADDFFQAEVEPRLARPGGQHAFAVIKDAARDGYVALPFAGIYFLVLWFEEPFQAELVRARMKRALPVIEALTVALPPTDGPTTEAAAVRLRRR